MINATVTGPMVRLEARESKGGAQYYEMVLAHITRNAGVIRKEYVTCIIFPRLVNYHLIPKVTPGELVTVIGPMEATAYIPQTGAPEPRVRYRVVADRVELHWDAPKRTTQPAAQEPQPEPSPAPTVTAPVEVTIPDDDALLEEILAER
jgi:hypothetical protein